MPALPGYAIALRSEASLTPAIMAAVWAIAAALDEAQVPAQVPNCVWLEVPTARLRGSGSQSDAQGAQEDGAWLRACLERLTGVRVSGEHRGDPWGAVVLAEWHVSQEGRLAHLLLTPAGVQVLRSPATFTRIEAQAARRLTGHGRRLYALLADKRHLGRPSWRFGADELRALMGVEGQTSYERFNTFRQRVLDPAVAAINAHGTVAVTMTPERLGRSVQWVRLDWRWKDPHEAAELVERTSAGTGMGEPHEKKPAQVQAKAQQPVQAEVPASVPEEPKTGPSSASSSGLVPDAQLPAPPEPQAAPIEPSEPVDPALTWWGELTDAERGTWGDKAGPISRIGSRMRIRTPEEVTRAAYVLFQAKEVAQAKQDTAKAKRDVAKARQKTPRASAQRRAVVKEAAGAANERESTGLAEPGTPLVQPPVDIEKAAKSRHPRRTPRLKSS